MLRPVADKCNALKPVGLERALIAYRPGACDGEAVLGRSAGEVMTAPPNIFYMTVDIAKLIGRPEYAWKKALATASRGEYLNGSAFSRWWMPRVSVDDPYHVEECRLSEAIKEVISMRREFQ